MKQEIENQKEFAIELKEELEYRGYLQLELSKATYIPIHRIRSFIKGVSTLNTDEIKRIKKTLEI